MSRFYLLVDSKFLYCYLTSKWIQAFNGHPNFGGVLLREAYPGDLVIEQRKAFHTQFCGETYLSKSMIESLRSLYVDFGVESQNSISLYGIPRYTFADAKNVIYLGQDLNGERAELWARNNLAGSGAWVFSHVGQILKPWWINCTSGRLLNMHSAVLPYARGANAVQNVAALNDAKELRKVAGATIHYIDSGVDTGSLLRAQRIAEPFEYETLWQLVAAIYDLGDSMYVSLAREIIADPHSLPAGFNVGAESQGPNYLRKAFTPERRQQAEQAFIDMRNQWLKEQEGQNKQSITC